MRLRGVGGSGDDVRSDRDVHQSSSVSEATENMSQVSACPLVNSVGAYVSLGSSKWMMLETMRTDWLPRQLTN